MADEERTELAAEESDLMELAAWGATLLVSKTDGVGGGQLSRNNQRELGFVR